MREHVYLNKEKKNEFIVDFDQKTDITNLTLDDYFLHLPDELFLQ